MISPCFKMHVKVVASRLSASHDLPWQKEYVSYFYVRETSDMFKIYSQYQNDNPVYICQTISSRTVKYRKRKHRLTSTADFPEVWSFYRVYLWELQQGWLLEQINTSTSTFSMYSTLYE